MKIVINAQFGGFSLSPLATKALAERKGRKCFFYANARKPDGGIDFDNMRLISTEDANREFMWFALDIPNADEVLTSSRNWPNMTEEQRQSHNAAWQQHSIETRDLQRNDPDLIAVVEKLGKKANGQHAVLKVVEIPDGVEWEVEEYDGYEHIAEKHRTWR